jgi:hypothetical protein
MHRLVVAALGIATALSGCMVREARIALAPGLAESAERIELTGMGGGRSGDFQLGQGSGTFTRSAERLGVFDPLLVRHRGGGAFRLRESTDGIELAGRCSYREGIVNAGPVSVTPGRLVFHCDFARGGRRIDASFMIAHPKSALGTLHGRDERTGMLVYEGREIAVRSIHRDIAGGLPTSTALGYSFSANGREIGAVDLNGLNKTLYVPRSGPDREAVIVASVALSTFWDPAIVQQD